MYKFTKLLRYFAGRYTQLRLAAMAKAFLRLEGAFVPSLGCGNREDWTVSS